MALRTDNAAPEDLACANEILDECNSGLCGCQHNDLPLAETIAKIIERHGVGPPPSFLASAARQFIDALDNPHATERLRDMTLAALREAIEQMRFE